MELNLDGKTALVTGGSKGIGRAVADELAAEGCHLHLASRTLSDLEAARDDLRGRYNVSVAIHAVDLSTDAGRQELIDGAGAVDILVNNAGAIPGGDIEDIQDDTWREAWDLKVFGYINLSRHYYGAMKKQGAGVIVNVCGIAGVTPIPKYIAGSTGNAALAMFSKTLGQESIRHGVRVLAVHPGPTLTERLIYLAKTWAEKELGDPERWEELPTDHRLGRAAEPREVADVVVFLASERASYMSGVAVDVG